MSDYLWDKQGEPDAEVARLEALLGAFAHEPRPLNLPTEAATPEPAPAKLLPFALRRRPGRLFAPVALAAAAALLVASVLVASAFLRARVVTRDERAAAPSETSRPKEEPTTTPEVERVTVETLPRVARQRKEVRVATVSRRQPRLPTAEPLTGEGLTLEKMSTPVGASSLVENTRLLTKEQLVYALRLTGAKLRDVRQKAQMAEARP